MPHQVVSLIRGKLLLSCLAVLLIASVSTAFIPSVHSTRPVITSEFTSTPPIIDGVFAQGDPWANNLQITMLEPEYPITAYVYILNDNDYLYFLVDGVGDTTDSSGDQCLLVFDFTPPYIKVRVAGLGGYQAFVPPYDAAIGYGSSPNSANSHKIYEFRIPWNYIGIAAGQSVDFSSPPWKSVSMPFDANTGRDNVWPQNLVVGDIETWAILYTSTSGPVGGYVESSNKPSIIAPYLALFAAFAAVAVATMAPRRKPEN